MGCQFDADKNIDFVVTNKEKIINEKLWNHGVLIGHVAYFFHFITKFDFSKKKRSKES